ncbi:MAG: ATP-binding protein [Anaerolineales bacterium]
MVTTRSDLADLLTHLGRIDDILSKAAKDLARQKMSDANAFRGLYVSDQEFEELLARPFASSAFMMSWESSPLDSLVPDSSLGHLVQAFDLSSFELDILLLSLLPAFDLRYERLFAYLQDDMTRKTPTMGLALDLFCPHMAGRLEGRQAFRDDASLMRYDLLRHQEEEGGVDSSLLAQSIIPAPHVVSFLLYGDLCHADLPHYLHLESPSITLSDLALAEDTLRRVRALTSAEFSSGLWIRERGGDGWSALGAARAMCWAWDIPLMRVSGTALQGGLEDVRRTARAVRRDSLLAGAAIYLDFAEGDGEANSRLRSLWAILSDLLLDHEYPLFWYVGAQAGAQSVMWDRADTVTLSFPAPDYSQRLSLWERALAEVEYEEGLSAPALASRYRLYGDQIGHILHMAEDSARWRESGDGVIEAGDITAAVRSLNEDRLGCLAQPIEVRHDWDDLVLPDDHLDQLREICDRYHHRHTVYDEWGFGRHAPAAGGLSALFAGPSGTGKTMAAEIIARELGLSLYRIDLSAVVSKYIGETEKNLERIFGVAQHANAILLFDEADALFGKRSETKDAHDRYANIEVSYLLQRMESFDGIAILTSNLHKNLDEAFMRRLDFGVEFPLPDEEARLHIWQRLLPPEAPTGDDLDLEELARRYRFSGGSIRNVLMNAAFLAARDGEVIDMQRVLWAARREFQKLGRLVDEGQFAV